MYTRIPSYREESRKEEDQRIPIPEHYGGVAFAKTEEERAEHPFRDTEEAHEAEAAPAQASEASRKEKSNPFSFLSRKGENGREDLLLLVLALLLLDGEGGDEALALMLLSLLFLG